MAAQAVHVLGLGLQGLDDGGDRGDQGLALTDLGLAAKAEIDRIREQSLNIE